MANALFKKEVLAQFDQTYGIIGMVEGNTSREYSVAERLKVYASDVAWAITIERLVYVPIAVRSQKSVHAGIRTWVFFWGNCLRPNWKPLPKMLILTVTSDPPEGRAFIQQDDHPHPHLNKAVAAMMVRGTRVPLECDPGTYDEMGISLVDGPGIRPFEALRALPRNCATRLLAEESEVAVRFKAGRIPPVILVLDEWRNPLVNELPSRLESIQMLAEVVSSGDAAKYNPTELPNTHWSNWPMAGSYDTEYGPEILFP